MNVKNKYFYGIINEPDFKIFDVIGINSSKVYSISIDKISAVVSDFGNDEIYPTRKNISIHATVQEFLMGKYTLLPAGFGVLASKNEMLDLLQKNKESIANEINRLSDVIEVVIKVYWDYNSEIKEIEVNNKEIVRIKSKINKTSSLLEKQNIKIDAGKLVESLLLDKRNIYSDDIYSYFKNIALDSHKDSESGIENVLNASFLVKKADKDDFIKSIHKLDEKYNSKFNFKCIAPLPPYTFLNVEMNYFKKPC